MTPSGIDPATFRFVAQFLNHCATRAPDAFNIKTNLRLMFPSSLFPFRQSFPPKLCA
jgi:hypothetical protein